MAETKLYEKHPSMFRNRPISFVICIALIAAYGLGLIILLFWWLKSCGTTLILTDERTTLRKGILSKHTTEVYHNNVRNVQVSQGILQRMFGVGTVGIASAGTGGLEIIATGMANPAKIKEIIDTYRRKN